MKRISTANMTNVSARNVTIRQIPMENVEIGVNKNMVGLYLLFASIKRIKNNGTYLKNGKQAITEHHQICWHQF
jgi:hypothetical protein